MIVSLTGVVAACSGQSPGPRAAQIDGEWGGPAIEITDSSAAHGIVVNTFCSKDFYPAPQVDSTGSFDVQGTRFWSTDVLAMGYSTHMTGTVHGNTLDVYMILAINEGKGPPTHLTLTRGQPADKSLIVCLR
ncbi:MAG TPA: hypothetical protein VGL65_03170 [Gemmatimonadales bacterium]